MEGRVEYSQTQDDQGVVKYWTDIVIQEMVMLGSTSGGGGDGGSFPGGGGAPPQPPASDTDGDLPF